MRRQSDLDDIYGVKRMKSNPLDRDDAPETGFRHSDSYHRYFRGYTEIRVPKEKGRFQIQRFYTQPWIVSTESSKDYRLKRVWMMLLSVFAWGAYITGMCLPVGSNRWWVTAIPGFATVIALVILSTVVIYYLFAPRKMTLWGYESTSKRLKRLSAGTGGCMAGTLAAKLVYLLLYGEAMEIRSCAQVLAAALAVAAIHRMERRTEYTTLPNNTVLPEGEAYEIW